MASEVVKWCDTHLSKGERVVGATWTLALTLPHEKTPRTFELDVCDDCAVPFVGLVADLSDNARQVGGPKTQPAGSVATVPAAASAMLGEFACPLCDKAPRTEAARDKHMQKYHGITYAEHLGENTHACPVPDCPRMLANPVGVAAHLRVTHGDWLAEHPEHQPASRRA